MWRCNLTATICRRHQRADSQNCSHLMRLSQTFFDSTYLHLAYTVGKRIIAKAASFKWLCCYLVSLFGVLLLCLIFGVLFKMPSITVWCTIGILTVFMRFVNRSQKYKTVNFWVLIIFIKLSQISEKRKEKHNYSK